MTRVMQPPLRRRCPSLRSRFHALTIALFSFAHFLGRARFQVRTLVDCHLRSSGETGFPPPLEDLVCCVQIGIGLVPAVRAHEHRLADTALLVDVAALTLRSQSSGSCALTRSCASVPTRHPLFGYKPGGGREPKTPSALRLARHAARRARRGATLQRAARSAPLPQPLSDRLLQSAS